MAPDRPGSRHGQARAKSSGPSVRTRRIQQETMSRARPMLRPQFLINPEDRCCGRAAGFAPQIVTPAGGRNVAWLLAPVPLDGQGTPLCRFWPSIGVLAAPCQFRLPVQACIRSMYAPRLSALASWRCARQRTALCLSWSRSAHARKGLSAAARCAREKHPAVHIIQMCALRLALVWVRLADIQNRVANPQSHPG